MHKVWLRPKQFGDEDIQFSNRNLVSIRELDWIYDYIVNGNELNLNKNENIRSENVEIFGIYNDAIRKLKSITINNNKCAIRYIIISNCNWWV